MYGAVTVTAGITKTTAIQSARCIGRRACLTVFMGTVAMYLSLLSSIA
jgi:hypothetical protein